MTMLADSVLGLFAKWPAPGQVKTRLAAETSPEFASAVAAAFLEDSIERLAAIPARRVLAYSPVDALPRFAAVVRDRFELVPQCSGDLGTRMTDFFRDRFAEGAQRVVLLGTDSPTLPLGNVTMAFHSLGSADVVIAPATDGGFCLVGVTPNMPPLFAGVKFSRADVLTQTLANLAGAKLSLLYPWYDIDTHDDWLMLRGHLAAYRAIGANIGAPRTEQLARESSV
ncbi:MAG: TIGR04282 family arsenosugar biosynthesis glycosyltransferase [Gemmataceae bacterium]